MLISRLDQRSLVALCHNRLSAREICRVRFIMDNYTYEMKLNVIGCEIDFLCDDDDEGMLFLWGKKSRSCMPQKEAMLPVLQGVVAETCSEGFSE
ncbi:hypothetical protein Scep_004061 [Stephania cephalantha]|uniref:Uncharacterized protein n=1 Tax=Stephania cephalantha TaxID=152367 RepID=A0AAP0KTK3_9MAGN